MVALMDGGHDELRSHGVELKRQTTGNHTAAAQAPLSNLTGKFSSSPPHKSLRFPFSNQNPFANLPISKRPTPTF
ncbi:hypothetical protein Droror1_Dr00023191 [Drosera rotundifolia]